MLRTWFTFALSEVYSKYYVYEETYKEEEISFGDVCDGRSDCVRIYDGAFAFP